jgi:CxxC motif-containing protein (DUF1111 family)
VARCSVLVVIVVAACRGGDAAGIDAVADDAPRSDASVIDASRPDAAEDGVDAAPPPPMPDPSTIAGPLTIPATSYGDRPFLTPANVDDVLVGPFSIGRELFVADWLVAPNSTRPLIDGLGPLLHAPSCLACHPADGRPPSLVAGGTVDVGVLFRLARPDGPAGALLADPVFGGQLQPSAIAGVPAEATITYSYDDAPPPDGIAPESARPVFAFATAAAYGALAPTTRAGPRLSPHLAGMGLLEAVSDAEILAREDPLDADGDGISGRAARLAGGAIGRFGWKAVQPTLHGQTAAAFAGDIGVTSPDRLADDCTVGQAACAAAPSGGAPELDADGIDAVNVFSRLLGVPAARRDNADPQLARGHAVFHAIGCAGCHVQSLTTAADATPAVLAGVDLAAYTDLLLHDLGPGLADPIGEGDASAAEWRTPPLWGLGLVELQPHARYLHDGRAASIADAIRWHGGEAEAARAAFTALSAADAAAVLAFLRSL